jgi:hypothetical protein
MYYMSLQYRNKSKSQLTSPTPAQLPAVALSAGHIVCTSDQFFCGTHRKWQKRPPLEGLLYAVFDGCNRLGGVIKFWVQSREKLRESQKNYGLGIKRLTVLGGTRTKSHNQK